MEISCTECSRAINIPDEKVPKDKAFNLTCPGCKAKFKVDQHLKPEPAKAGSPEEESDVIHTSHLVDSAEQTFEEDEDEEFYEEGDRVALILDTKNADTWTEVLEELEYKVQLAQTPDHAAHKIKYFLYDIVILHETSMGVALKENPVYELILKLPMSDRRKIFVILVGDKFKTADNMRAYSLSVNLVVNEKNFDKIEIILKKAFSDNNAFYKIFKDTLQTLGKI